MGVIIGRVKLKCRELAHHQLLNQKRPHFSPLSKAKANIIEVQISRKFVTSGISDVAITSAHSEKTCMKKMIMIITRKMVPIKGRASASFSSLLKL